MRGEGRIHPGRCLQPTKFQLVPGWLSKSGGFGEFSSGSSSALGGSCAGWRGLLVWSVVAGGLVPGNPSPEHPKDPKCRAWSQGALFQEEILCFGNGS